MAYEFIDVRTEAGKVGVITLNRPKQLNALNNQLMDELGQAMKAFDADEAIGCMILTGSEKAFAAGADIGAMATYTFGPSATVNSLSTDISSSNISSIISLQLCSFLTRPAI